MASTDLKKPLYAAAGVGDLAVERLRRLPTIAVALQHEVQEKAAALPAKARELDPAAVRTNVSRTATDAQQKAAGVYGELVDRGRRMVTSIRRQQATQDLLAQAQNTTASVRRTITTARKSAGRTKNSAEVTATTAKKAAARTRTAAKSTTTSARKTAGAAVKAAEDGATKVG